MISWIYLQVLFCKDQNMDTAGTGIAILSTRWGRWMHCTYMSAKTWTLWETLLALLTWVWLLSCVSKDVSPQSACAIIGRVGTVRALMQCSLSSRMNCAHVNSSMWRICEALTALLTWVWLLSGVNTDVRPQITSTIFGRVRTMRALMQCSLSSRMNCAHVSSSTWRMCEALTTFLTWVWLLSGVNTDVRPQITSTIFGRVRTMRALMQCSLSSRMNCAHVSSSTWRMCEALTTLLTWVWLLSCVNTDVTSQISSVFGRVGTVWALM